METAVVIAGLAAAGLLWWQGKKKTDNKIEVEREDKPGATTKDGIPIIPKLIPDSRMILTVNTMMVSAPAAWQIAPLEQFDIMYLGIFADQAFLYSKEIKKDFQALASYLASKGQKGVLQIEQDRLENQPIGEILVEFDSNLPAQIRALTFWRLAAQKWDALEEAFASEEYAKYPKFAKSIKTVMAEGAKPVGFYGSAGGPGASEKWADKDRPETWLLANVTGPANVQTPKGVLFVPAGGRIVDGRPQQIVAEGDYGAKIADKWGKPAGWANKIASENPNEKFGGSNNTVFAGDVLNLPHAFLDPTIKSNPPSQGGGGAKQPDKKEPEENKTPYGPPPPPPDGGGEQGGGEPPSPPVDNGGQGGYPGAGNTGGAGGYGGAPPSYPDGGGGAGGANSGDGSEGSGGYGDYGHPQNPAGLG